MGIKRNIVLQTITQVSSRGLGFLFFLIVARKLGADHFGLFSFALGIGALLAIPMDLGMDSLLTKWAARGQEKVITAAFHGRIVLTVGIWLLFVLVVLTLIRSNQMLICLVGLYSAILINIQTHAACFRGFEKMHLETWVLTLQKASAILLVALSLHFSASPESAAVSLILSTLIGLAAVRTMARRHGIQTLILSVTKESYRNIQDNLRSILKESLPLLVVIIGWNVYFRIDIVMLKAYVQDVQIGYYFAAYKIMEGIGIFPSILLAALFPALARRSLQAPDKARRLLAQALILLVPSSLLLLGLFRGLSDFFISTIYGQEYSPAIPLFRILIWAVLAVFPGYLFTQSLIAYDKNVQYSIITLLAAALNVGLNLLLIPRSGAAGAAWATVVTEGFVTILCCIAMGRIFFKRDESQNAP